MRPQSKKLRELMRTNHIAVYFSKAMAEECATLLTKFLGKGIPVTPSEEQASALRKLSENWNVIVNACAGSGKTTVLLMAITKYIKKNVPSLTVHSLAYQALIKHFGNIFRVDENKLEKTLKKFINSREEDPERQRHFLGKLLMFFGEARAVYTPPHYKIKRVINHVAKDSSVFTWIEGDRKSKLAEMLKPFTDDELTELWQTITSVEPTNWGNCIIDFEDMIYLYHAHKVPPIKTYTTIFVDEAQDLRHHYFKILRDHADKYTRWYIVGDRKQSIMGWNGVASTQFDENTKYIRGTWEVGFTKSFRNNRRNEEAIRYLLKENAEAYLAQHRVHREDEGKFELVTQVQFIPNALYIARYRWKLLPLYMEAIREGYLPILSGFDLYKEIEKLKGYGWYLTENDDEKRTAAELVLVGINGKITNKKSLIEILEKEQWMLKIRLEREILFLETLKIYLTYLFSQLKEYAKKSISTLLKTLKNYIEAQPNKIYFSSGHSSKGQEANYVYLIDVDNFFDERAVTAEQIIQELNLLYVVATRSKIKTYGVKGEL